MLLREGINLQEIEELEDEAFIEAGKEDEEDDEEEEEEDDEEEEEEEEDEKE